MRSLKTTLFVLLLAGGALLVARYAAEERHAKAARTTAEAKAGALGVDASGRTSGEKKAIARLSRAGWRPAEDEDAEESESRQELQDVYVEYHPFFVRGDLDGDGRLDFAQAYRYEVGGEPRFDVAVFFGNADGTFRGPVFVERGVDLSGGDLAIERTVLIVTPDLSQDDTRRWRWERRDGKFHEVDEEETEEDTPDETPDERPRARI